MDEEQVFVHICTYDTLLYEQIEKIRESVSREEEDYHSFSDRTRRSSVDPDMAESARTAAECKVTETLQVTAPHQKLPNFERLGDLGP